MVSAVLGRVALAAGCGRKCLIFPPKPLANSSVFVYNICCGKLDIKNPLSETKQIVINIINSKEINNMTNNKHVLSWIEEMAALVNPTEIVWIDGSEEQAEALRA